VKDPTKLEATNRRQKSIRTNKRKSSVNKSPQATETFLHCDTTTCNTTTPSVLSIVHKCTKQYY